MSDTTTEPEAKGERASFCGTGNTAHAGKFVKDLDAERPSVCKAYGVRYRSILDHIQILSADGRCRRAKSSRSIHFLSRRRRSSRRHLADMDGYGLAPWHTVTFVLLAEDAG